MPDYMGQQIGNYRLVHLIGRGGFADVYLGQHIHLNTQAAIKLLQVRLTGNDIEQFRIEAQTIANLVHPNVVRVLDFGLQENLPFLVMDYAPHGSLRQLHPLGSRLSLGAIVAYVKQVSAALHYAHQRKLIHRDVKPENILLGRDNEVLLSDFGLVLPAYSSGSLTTKEMAGTVPYMAPEQIQGKPRPASDQYALGIIVYEWLCGERPFRGSALEVYGQHLHASPPPLHEKVAGFSPALEAVVLTALAKQPQQRFASVEAFANALEQASTPVQGHSQVFPPVISPYNSSSVTEGPTHPASGANPLVFPSDQSTFVRIPSEQSTFIRTPQNQPGGINPASNQSTLPRTLSNQPSQTGQSPAFNFPPNQFPPIETRQSNRGPSWRSIIAGLLILAIVLGGGGIALLALHQGSSAAASRTPGPNAAVTATATSTLTPSPTATATPSPTPTPSSTPSPTATATPSPTPSPSPTPTQPVLPNPAPYRNTWVNDDPNTGGITRLIISGTDQTLIVHGYGKCHPTDCDWGTRSGTLNKEPFVILFDFGGGLTHELTISFNDAAHTQLKVVDNGSRSGVNTYFFHRQ